MVHTQHHSGFNFNGRRHAWQEVLSLKPIIVAVIVWGRSWQGCMVRCKCDNAAVVLVVGSRYSKCSDIMHLLRCLFFAEVYYYLYVTAVHLPRVENSMADITCLAIVYLLFCCRPTQKKKSSTIFKNIIMCICHVVTQRCSVLNFLLTSSSHTNHTNHNY